VRQFLCTNPACRHSFTANEPPKGRSVICPRCGHGCDQPSSAKLKRPPQTATSPPRKSDRPPTGPAQIAPPQPSPPAPATFAPVAPVAPIAAAPTADTVEYSKTPLEAVPVSKSPPTAPTAPIEIPMSPSAKLVRVHELGPRRGPFGLLKTVIILLLLALFVGTALYVVSVVQPGLLSTKGTPAGGSRLVFSVRDLVGREEKAFSLSVDKDYWSADKDLKATLKSLAAFRHQEEAGEAWFAIAVQDFGSHMPRQSELVNGALERLRKLFGDTLQFDEKVVKTQILGGDALGFPFKGRSNLVFEGECCLVAYQGLGYWFFFAGSEPDVAALVRKQLEDDSAIAILAERRNWHEDPPEVASLQSSDKAFVLQAPAGVWQKFDPLTVEEHGVLYYSGTFNRDPDPSKAANVFAVKLDRISALADAYKFGRDHLEGLAKAGANDYALQPLDESDATGRLLETSGPQACIGEMRLVRAGQVLRYWLVGVVNDESATYAVRFECGWDRRSVWRQEFLDMLKTWKSGKK
jgi:hypothetical protein